jgi:hypothetical protein
MRECQSKDMEGGTKKRKPESEWWPGDIPGKGEEGSKAFDLLPARGEIRFLFLLRARVDRIIKDPDICPCPEETTKKRRLARRDARSPGTRIGISLRSIIVVLSLGYAQQVYPASIMA